MRANLFTQCFLFLFLSLYSIESYSLEVPRHTGPVVDLAGFLSKKEQALLASSLYKLKKQKNVELQLLTIDSLEGRPIENFSLKVVEKWRLGGKKTDKGILFIISHKDRKMRIEVGQGLEGDLPDITAGRIMNSVKPYFKKNDYRSGIILGLSKIANAVGGTLKNSPRVRNKRSRSSRISLLVFVFFLIVSFFGRGGRGGGGLLAMLLMGGAAGYGRGRYDGCNGGFTGLGGGGSGGSFGGGGGGFSGGGASGDW